MNAPAEADQVVGGFFFFGGGRLSSAGDYAFWRRASRAARLANTAFLAVSSLCTAPSPAQDGGRGSESDDGFATPVEF